ncbi:hypothetical protein KKD37_02560 [Patescibacteria group bacterium]|nr:hypothetical protein [Patescibacteria group bacterium]
MPTDKRVLDIYAKQKSFGKVGPMRASGGWLVPIYFDVRTALSQPKNLKAFANIFAECIKKNGIKFDAIVGGATAGMPIALALAMKLNKPFLWVRKIPKKGGMGKAVEGYFEKGWKVLLVDDVIVNGTSKAPFIKNIRKAGLIVDTIMVTLRRPKIKSFSKIKNLKVKVYDFGSLDVLMEYMAAKNYITQEALKIIKWYTEYPDTWHQDPKKMEFLNKYKKNKKNSISKI